MKALKTLIRLQRQQLNELRRTLMTLERQRAELVTASIRLSEELQREIESATDMPEMSHFFGNYSERIQKRQDEIGQQVREIDKKSNEVSRQIAAAFSEVKKFEIALENHLKRLREEENRRETIMLDDIGQQQYLKRQEEGAKA